MIQSTIERRLPSLKKLGKNFLVEAGQVLSLRIAGAASLFIFSLVIAHMLGVDRFGVFYLALTIATVVGTLGVLGTDQAGMRAIARARAENDQDRVHALYRGSLKVILGFSVILSFLILVSSVALAHLLSEPRLALPLAILALSIPGYALGNFYGSALRAVGKTKSAVIVLQNLAYFVSVPLLALYYFGIGGRSVAAVATIYTLSVYATVFIAVRLWVQYVGKKRVELRSTVREIIKYSLPFFWISSIEITFVWVDILILGALSNAHAVGLFVAANRISKLTTFILFAVNMIVAPHFARLYSQGKLKELKSLAHGSTLIAITATLPIAIVILLFPGFILGLFGSGFRDSVTALIVLTLGQAVNAFTGAIVLLLTMTKYEKLLRNIMLAALLLDGLLDIILIPHLGIVGAAIGSATGMTFLNVTAVIVAQRKLGLSTLPLPFLNRKEVQV